MHQELGSGPHHCSSVALIYYPVCLHSYLRPRPASTSIKHTQTHLGWHIHTSAHWLSAPCLPGHWDTCMHTYILLCLCTSPHTLISTLTYAALTAHTYTCSSNGEFSHASFSYHPPLHHCRLFFSSCILIFFLQTLSLSHKSPEDKCV